MIAARLFRWDAPCRRGSRELPGEGFGRHPPRPSLFFDSPCVSISRARRSGLGSETYRLLRLWACQPFRHYHCKISSNRSSHNLV